METKAAGEKRKSIWDRLTERGAASFYREVRYEEELPSTNDTLKEAAKRGEPGTVALACGRQTAGRGRRGRSWSGADGEAIAFSVLLRPALPPEEIAGVTPVMGIAAAEAIREMTGLPVLIKWPNDLVLFGKKLSGTLAELVQTLPDPSGYGAPQPAAVVIGTGVNVNQETFPEEIAEVAVSLRQASGKTYDTESLTGEILAAFASCYAVFEREGFRALSERYNALLTGKGQEVTIETPAESWKGTAVGADEQGRLMVRDESGVLRRVFAGEVSVRGLYRVGQ